MKHTTLCERRQAQEEEPEQFLLADCIKKVVSYVKGMKLPFGIIRTADDG